MKMTVDHSSVTLTEELPPVMVEGVEREQSRSWSFSSVDEALRHAQAVKAGAAIVNALKARKAEIEADAEATARE